MYIVLHTSKDESLISSLKEEVKKMFPSYSFSSKEAGERGSQLLLLGTQDEAKPVLFVNGFVAAWSLKNENIKNLDNQNSV